MVKGRSHVSCKQYKSSGRGSMGGLAVDEKVKVYGLASIPTDG